ncbi:MAG TPA: hypothetical protein VMA98_11245 [Candidatus Acidoferrales bacterium]|nr:hypothetical protein [Candidatus Acidoferrales bacterium]
MIDLRSSLRRFFVAAAALALAFPLLRPAISEALVSRGDALLYARDGRAMEKYHEAWLLDRGSSDAADRYVFAAFLARRELESAVDVATATLTVRPRDVRLRMDRALCLHVLGRIAAASRDFEQAGREARDVQALALAADDAMKLHELRRTRTLLSLAHRIDPGYLPVARALRRIE